MTTPPRKVIAGTTYIIERSTSELRYFLTPDNYTEQTFDYYLAHAAKTYGVLIHEYILLCNRYFLLATDPQARLPEFSKLLQSMLTCALTTPPLHTRGATHLWPKITSLIRSREPGTGLVAVNLSLSL